MYNLMIVYRNSRKRAIIFKYMYQRWSKLDRGPT